jgi:hypothetical protein
MTYRESAKWLRDVADKLRDLADDREVVSPPGEGAGTAGKEEAPPAWIKNGVRVIYQSAPGPDCAYQGTVNGEPWLLCDTWVVNLRNMDLLCDRRNVTAAACFALRPAVEATEVIRDRERANGHEILRVEAWDLYASANQALDGMVRVVEAAKAWRRSNTPSEGRALELAAAVDALATPVAKGEPTIWEKLERVDLFKDMPPAKPKPGLCAKCDSLLTHFCPCGAHECCCCGLKLDAEDKESARWQDRIAATITSHGLTPADCSGNESGKPLDWTDWQVSKALNEARTKGVLEFAKAILHGDKKHQAWLLLAARDFAGGWEMSPPPDATKAPAPTVEASGAERCAICHGEYVCTPDKPRTTSCAFDFSHRFGAALVDVSRLTADLKAVEEKERKAFTAWWNSKEERDLLAKERDALLAQERPEDAWRKAYVCGWRDRPWAFNSSMGISVPPYEPPTEAK